VFLRAPPRRRTGREEKIQKATLQHVLRKLSCEWVVYLFTPFEGGWGDVSLVFSTRAHGFRGVLAKGLRQCGVSRHCFNFAGYNGFSQRKISHSVFDHPASVEHWWSSLRRGVSFCCFFFSREQWVGFCFNHFLLFF